MAAPPYMKFYVADYLADTTSLKRAEHGAYLLLLMAMWRAGGKLPAVDAKLAQITKCTPKEWAEIRDTILAFFTRRGGQLTHKRLAAEMAKADHVSGVRKQASDKGVSAKRSKNSGKADTIGDPNADQLGTYIKHQTSEDKPPKPPEGASDLIGKDFEKAWAAYPDTTTTSRERALEAFVAELPRAGGCAPLAAAVEGFAAHQLAGGAKAKTPPAFHVWLARRRYDTFLRQAAAPRHVWTGPQEVWDVVAKAMTPAFANSWLGASTWQPEPPAVISPTTAYRRLSDAVGAVLGSEGIQLLERAA